jgi:hypothetical protein
MARGDSWISNRCAGNINAASPVKRGQGTNENGRTIAETARHLIRAVACATMMGLSAVAWCLWYWKTTAAPSECPSCGDCGWRQRPVAGLARGSPGHLSSQPLNRILQLVVLIFLKVVSIMYYYFRVVGNDLEAVNGEVKLA